MYGIGTQRVCPRVRSDVMDMGGSFKKIADGINVGKEKGNAISTVEYAQRVVAIPPKKCENP